MKKIIIIITAIMMCIPCISQAAESFDDSNITAVSAMLIDAKTGEVLYEKGGNEKISPASTTKLMTALLTIENVQMDDIVVPGDEVNQFNSSSSLADINAGESISVKDLMHGMLMVSGNDAAAALAVHIGGTLEAFNGMMNAKAKELGMENTHFSNPHGLKVQNQEQYSTASDMSKLAKAAYARPEIMEITQKINYTIEPTNTVKEARELKNTNVLLVTPKSRPEYSKYLYEYATGMKTGLIENPSYACLVASAKRDNSELIALVFGDESSGAAKRWQYVIDMFNYGFENFSKVDLSTYIMAEPISQNIENYATNDPEEGLISLLPQIDANVPSEVFLSVPVAEGLSAGTLAVEEEIVLTKPLVAPISQGEEMGYVNYKLNGEIVYKAPLLANRKVYQTGEEELLRKAYNLNGFEFQTWYLLFIIIPVAAVILFLMIRIYSNKPRRRRSYSHQYKSHSTQRRITTYDYGAFNDSGKKHTSNYAQKALRGRKL